MWAVLLDLVTRCRRRATIALAAPGVLYRQFMGRDWETWLRNGSGPASVTEEGERDRTEQRVRDAIRASADLPRSVKVYAKGSYANGTNVRRNADVDIAVEWTETQVVHTWGETFGLDETELGYTPVEEQMTKSEFRRLVEEALLDYFGSDLVDATQDKHIGLTETGGTLEADVVPCFALARYDRPKDYAQGIRIYPKSGSFVDNFPQQNLDNSIQKNRDTRQRYKQMVRCMKRLVVELSDAGTIPAYPGYLVESLMYNVPNQSLGNTSRYEDVANAVRFLWSGLRDDSHLEWTEPNALLYLFRGRSDRIPANAFRVIDSVWDKLELS
jgi:hypothetical protein